MRVGELIAVVSGKGGTGKTSVTALLATALAQSGKRVLCIDCDVGLRKSLSRVRLQATPWAAAYQAPPSMGFSRQEYWSGVPLPSPLF